MKYIQLIIFLGALSSSAFALTKEELFTKLYTNNLMLKEEQANLKAIEASSATSWSAPELAVSEMNSNTPFLNGDMKMVRSIELSQMLPNPQRVSANNAIKKSYEKVQTEQVNILYKKLKKDAYSIFLGIYQNRKELEIITNKKIQLEKFYERLKSSQIQGQDEKIQISEAQSDLNEIKLNLTLNNNEYQRMVKMLNQMLGNALYEKITDPILEEIVLDKKIDIQKSTDLKILESKINLMESDLSMKKSEFIPEFSLKAKLNKSYVPNIDNSKELMVGITLPFLFWGQQANGVETTRLKIEAMKHAKDNQLSESQTKLETLQSEMEDLIITLHFLKESSLAVRERKMKLFTNYSYTDMKSLMSYKMSFDDVFMIKMKILEKEIELQKKYFEWSQLEG
jgi:outer membrane protein TolC